MTTTPRGDVEQARFELMGGTTFYEALSIHQPASAQSYMACVALG